MGNYNSANTKVLERCEKAGGNVRMLLLYEHGTHREYIVGSYFHETPYDGALGYEHYDYEWSWGHYFPDIVSAVEFWKSDVLEREW